MGLINALQFLTILRFKRQYSQDAQGLGSSSLYFPLVGAFLGLVLIALDKILFLILPVGLINIILIFTLIITNGALHIDGLADSFDALFSSKSKEEMLSIMHEVHKGTFGVLAIVAVISFKIALLSAIPTELRCLSLFLMAVLSRYSMSLAVTFFPYARDNGKAKVFFQQKKLKYFIISTIIVFILLALTPRFMNLIVFFLMVAFTFFASSWVNKKIGGLTGDSLGALSELNEVLVLLSVFVLSKIYI